MKTVLFVRHGDIDFPPTVPDELIELNAAGRVRAAELVRVAEAAGVTSIFTSAAKRTKQTAAPLAAALHLRPKPVSNSLSEFVAAVPSAATGSTILVVGHSTTVLTRR
jgi:broad specificity phosphatase PhoE